MMRMTMVLTAPSAATVTLVALRVAETHLVRVASIPLVARSVERASRRSCAGATLAALSRRRACPTTVAVAVAVAAVVLRSWRVMPAAGVAAAPVALLEVCLTRLVPAAPALALEALACLWMVARALALLTRTAAVVRISAVVVLALASRNSS